MDIAKRKIIRVGKSYAVIVPNDIAKRTIEEGRKEQWIAIVEHHEAPTNGQLLSYLLGFKKK